MPTTLLPSRTFSGWAAGDARSVDTTEQKKRLRGGRGRLRHRRCASQLLRANCKARRIEHESVYTRVRGKSSTLVPRRCDCSGWTLPAGALSLSLSLSYLIRSPIPSPLLGYPLLSFFLCSLVIRQAWTTRSIVRVDRPARDLERASAILPSLPTISPRVELTVVQRQLEKVLRTIKPLLLHVEFTVNVIPR